MECGPQNPEFRKNSENFHQCLIRSMYVYRVNHFFIHTRWLKTCGTRFHTNFKMKT